ncbi:hypothetical protein WHR41_06768 [Cladosporium halotolerans]|uniref:Uncharacterized protein n=1 Tax=Cladosporium halotolerans TaxID=1052096 RepID=A0AB34KK95_9PEZI
MTCDVAHFPLSDTRISGPFDIEADGGDDVDLSAISEFNSTFENLDESCVDPQNLSKAGSPSFIPGPPLTPNYNPDVYPADPSSTPVSPYFESIEHPMNPPYIPSPLGFQDCRRRSVSEPPDLSFLHQMPQPDVPMFFHRDGHKLGAPRGSKRIKQSRVRPYERSLHHVPPPQHRFHFRHATMQHPPTSAPNFMVAPTPPPGQHVQSRSMQILPTEPQFVSSRVCTPAPEAVDPALGTPLAGIVPHARMAGYQSQVDGNTPMPSNTLIKMGVDELCVLITEIVQKAIQELQKPGAAVDTALERQDGGEIDLADFDIAEGVMKVETGLDDKTKE